MVNLQSIENVLKKINFNYDLGDGVVRFGFSSDAEKIPMNVICSCDDGTFTMVIYSMHTSKKTSAIQNAIEEANFKYKYWKFSLDGDNDLRMMFQTPVDFLGSAEVCIVMLVSASAILDDFYSDFQRARFAVDEQDETEFDLEWDE